jgi:hypothetical protein
MLRTVLNSVQLFWSALGVFRREPGLLLFVPFWGVAFTIVAGVAGLALQDSGAFDRLGNASLSVADVLFILFAHILACFVTMCVVGALVSAAYHRFEGGGAALRDGLDAANEQLGGIFIWSVFAGTLGFLIKPLVTLPGLIGRTTSSAVGDDFTSAATLVPPVMLIEAASPLQALERANDLFADTWGGGSVPNFNLALPFLLLSPLAAAAGAGAYFGTESLALAIGLAGGLGLLGYALFRVCQVIVAVALYYFTVGGDRGILPEHVLQLAYVPAVGRGRWRRSDLVRRPAAPLGETDAIRTSRAFNGLPRR